jgi:NAD(P)-dependent dehydrogenase (short-subunit alcohol dehydrogenase family)
MTRISRAVLVTGCSTGIGRATAKMLAGRGWVVYASARRLETIDDLEGSGCRILTLDVTDDDSCAAAVRTIVEAEGSVGVLVNNAGVQELGAVETVPVDRVRALFETNVFGAVRLSQLVLPGMRAQGWGRIVNVGSMNGRFVFPGMGGYAATKHAMEAISDALRFEVSSFGVGVALIQPGMVRTPLAATAAARRAEASGDGAYAAYNESIADLARRWDRGLNARLACGPEDVARVIVKAVEARGRPRARYRVAASARLLLTLRAVLSDTAFDAFMRLQFPTPGQSR